MGLESMISVKSYRIGVFAPRDFEDRELLANIFLPKLASIEKIITNNVDSGGVIVRNFCLEAGIPVEIYPITSQVGSVLSANNKIINASEYVVIFDNGISENNKHVISACKDRNKKFSIKTYINQSKSEKYRLALINLQGKISDEINKKEKEEYEFENQLNKIISKVLI